MRLSNQPKVTWLIQGRLLLFPWPQVLLLFAPLSSLILLHMLLPWNRGKLPGVVWIGCYMGNLELILIVVLTILNYKCLYSAVCSCRKCVPLKQGSYLVCLYFLRVLLLSYAQFMFIEFMNEWNVSVVFIIMKVRMFFSYLLYLHNSWAWYKVNLDITASWNSSLITTDNPCLPLLPSEEREGDKPLSAAPDLPSSHVSLVTWPLSECILIGDLVWFLLNHEPWALGENHPYTLPGTDSVLNR